MSRISALLSQLCCSVTTTYSSCAPGTTTVALPAGLQVYRKRPPDHQRPDRTLCGLSRSVLGRKHASNCWKYSFPQPQQKPVPTSLSKVRMPVPHRLPAGKGPSQPSCKQKTSFFIMISPLLIVCCCRGVHPVFVATFWIRMSRPRNFTGLKYFPKKAETALWKDTKHPRHSFDRNEYRGCCCIKIISGRTGQ